MTIKALTKELKKPEIKTGKSSRTSVSQLKKRLYIPADNITGTAKRNENCVAI